MNSKILILCLLGIYAPLAALAFWAGTAVERAKLNPKLTALSLENTDLAEKLEASRETERSDLRVLQTSQEISDSRRQRVESLEAELAASKESLEDTAQRLWESEAKTSYRLKPLGDAVADFIASTKEIDEAIAATDLSKLQGDDIGPISELNRPAIQYMQEISKIMLKAEQTPR